MAIMIVSSRKTIASSQSLQTPEGAHLKRESHGYNILQWSNYHLMARRLSVLEMRWKVEM
jgi:hypothetical protein